MAKEKTVYAPGELAKVRDKLGTLDQQEAKRMAQLLGGEVGYERSENQETVRSRPRRTRPETVEAGARGSSRRVERPGNSLETSRSGARKKKSPQDDSSDNPAVPIKTNYWERVKMDRYCAQFEFGIKNSGQVLGSIFSFFKDPPDKVAPSFVNKRMNEYYQRLELLVTSIRTLLPRGNTKRLEKLRRVSPFAFSILETMRYWNIEQILINLSRIQTHPRNVTTADFSEILQYIYKPLYILEQLDPEIHIKGAFKILYKVLFLESPEEAKTKFQEVIRTALASYGVILRDVRFQLYPLLMKLLSHCFLPYSAFFAERKNRLEAFLQVSGEDRINPRDGDGLAVGDVAEISQAVEEENAPEEKAETPDGDGEIFDESGLEELPSEEEKAKRQALESEAKALERGLAALEMLFPEAGWDDLAFFPDLYPYFFDVFKLKKGVALIAPTDPLQQVYMLSRILEELCEALRFTAFGAITGYDGARERIDEPLGRIVNEWRKIFEDAFEKEYFKRLSEYCRLLENTAESRTSNYAKRLLNELYWTKRLYFLPSYKFDSIMPPPFQKDAIEALYPEIRSLRRYLTAVAAGIEQGNKQGGAETRALCEGIENPWDSYIFQIPNPVSKRMDALLPPKKRNNAALIYFSLAVTVVLDHLVNNPNSWAYGEKNGFLFRSENGEGSRPLFGVDNTVDTEQIFKQVLKKRQAEAAQAEAQKKSPENGG
ncbi:MAG: hypothetical protein LBG84_03660 [Treponema sp.]|jgi:hypothetical protein|nr:hypothetical protein [Treponema sp.]